MITTGVLNCTTSISGTYFDGCEVTKKNFTKPFLISPNAVIDLTSGTFDKAAIALLIKKGQLIPLNNMLAAKDAAAKTNVETLPNKVKLFVSDGLYDFSFEFIANVCLIKSLRNLTKRKWGLCLLDSEGKFFFDKRGGAINGFEIAFLAVENETINDGGSKTAKFMLECQLSPDGTKGFNERADFVLADDTNGLLSTNGIEDTVIAPVTSTAANFVVSVVAGCDKSTPKIGLTTANFRVLKASDGSIAVATVAEVGNGQYKLSGAGIVAGAVTVQLYDTVNNLAVADILTTRFFQSNILPVVLT